jgi:hypothetical protein
MCLMPWTVLWPSGDRVEAPDAPALLAVIGSQQMNPMDRENPKAALAWRCHVMFGATVDVALPDAEFLRACQKVGLFRLDVTGA